MIPLNNAENPAIRDNEGRTVGREMARLDRSLRRDAATDDEIRAYLAQVASGEVTGWAEDACIKSYRREWQVVSRPGSGW